MSIIRPTVVVLVALAGVVATDRLSLASECGDVDGSGAIAASDALLVLQKAVGAQVPPLQCPVQCTSTTTTTSTTTSTIVSDCFSDTDCGAPVLYCCGYTCSECAQDAHCPSGFFCSDCICAPNQSSGL
jgi:Cys-rich repeat protein